MEARRRRKKSWKLSREQERRGKKKNVRQLIYCQVINLWHTETESEWGVEFESRPCSLAVVLLNFLLLQNVRLLPNFSDALGPSILDFSFQWLCFCCCYVWCHQFPFSRRTRKNFILLHMKMKAKVGSWNLFFLFSILSRLSGTSGRERECVKKHTEKREWKRRKLLNFFFLFSTFPAPLQPAGLPSHEIWFFQTFLFPSTSLFIPSHSSNLDFLHPTNMRMGRENREKKKEN